MFNFFNKNIIKGFKVCKNSERSKKYGIASATLTVLYEKIEEKFKIKNFQLFYDDALVNEEYFKTIPNQATIVIVEDRETYKTDFDVIFDLFRKTYHDTFNARDLINNFIINKQNEDLIKNVIKLQNEMDEKTKVSDREGHPEWFSNVEIKKSITKETIMRTKAKDRIKGYFYKTKDELTKSRIYQVNSEGRKIIDDLITDFFIFLSGVDFFECLFDRSHCKKFLSSDEIDAKTFVKRRKVDMDTKLKIKRSNMFDKYLVSLCNDIGIFNCHGLWNLDKCMYDHKINPYSTREALILFQIFNLDHQIEISRSIFPSILKNTEKLCTEKNLICKEHDKNFTSLSIITYFLEIFTVKNLKLVHIICHDKGSHDLETKGRLLCEGCKEMKLIKKFKMKIS